MFKCELRVLKLNSVKTFPELEAKRVCRILTNLFTNLNFPGISPDILPIVSSKLEARLRVY